MRENKGQKGSVLFLSLWAVGLLSVFAVCLGAGLRQKLEFLDRIETRNKLVYIAEAGIKQAISVIGNFEKDRSFIGLNEAWSNNKDMFYQMSVGEGWFTVGYDYFREEFRGKINGNLTPAKMNGAVDVESKLNVNTAEPRELLRLIQKIIDIDEVMADTIASSIVDWRDEDNQSLLNGAEDKYYRGLRFGYKCKDFPFQSLEELYYVKGMTPDIFSKIKTYLTIYGSGKVNINTTSAKVLYALGLENTLVEKILLFRCGEDEVEASGDDRVFTSPSSVVKQLSQVYNLSSVEETRLTNLISAGKISTFSNVFMISSLACLEQKPGKCQIMCVFEKDLNEDSEKAGLILDWRVSYFI